MKNTGGSEQWTSATDAVAYRDVYLFFFCLVSLINSEATRGPTPSLFPSVHGWHTATTPELIYPVAHMQAPCLRLWFAGFSFQVLQQLSPVSTSSNLVINVHFGGIDSLWFVITVDHHQMLNNVPCVCKAPKQVPHSPFYCACRDHLRHLYILFFSPLFLCFVFEMTVKVSETMPKSPFLFPLSILHYLGTFFFIFIFCQSSVMSRLNN